MCDTASHRSVFIGEDGSALTNSKAVAEGFDKEHKHVLRDIDTLLAHSPDLDHEYFQEVSSPHPTVPGRMDRSYNMNRDGFALLAMGFTVEKVARWNDPECPPLPFRPMG